VQPQPLSSNACCVTQAVTRRFGGLRWPRLRGGGGGGWTLAGFGFVQREGSGSSVATSTSAATVPGVHRPPRACVHAMFRRGHVLCL